MVVSYTWCPPWKGSSRFLRELNIELGMKVKERGAIPPREGGVLLGLGRGPTVPL